MDANRATKKKLDLAMALPVPESKRRTDTVDVPATMLLTGAEWTILGQLYDETLTWGATVGAVWPNLHSRRLVEPKFGPITDKGRRALESYRSPSKAAALGGRAATR